MRRSSCVLTLALGAAALSGCNSADEVASLQKEVGGLREDVQRAKKENEKLASQMAAQARRIDGLSADISTVRQLTVDVRTAPEAQAGEVFTAGPAAGDLGAAGGPALSPHDVVAIRTFLSTPDGRKVVTDAIDAERESREVERDRRRADVMVDRFAKTAALTEDQTKRMKEIMGRAVVARRALGSMRDLGMDATPEEREAFRTEFSAKTDAIRQQTDAEVKAALSSTQFEAYQQQQAKLRNTLRGNGRNGTNPRPNEPNEN